MFYRRAYIISGGFWRSNYRSRSYWGSCGIFGINLRMNRSGSLFKVLWNSEMSVKIASLNWRVYGSITGRLNTEDLLADGTQSLITESEPDSEIVVVILRRDSFMYRPLRSLPKKR
jgi:hypothetical protein